MKSASNSRPCVAVPEPRQQQHEVVAAVLARGDSVLLCHRGPGRWYPNAWDLPGGHIDVGESASVALRRELQEELGIETADLTPQPALRLATDAYDLRVWLITEWSGEPRNMAADEHDAIAWFATPAIGRLRLVDDRYVSLINQVLAGGNASTAAETSRNAASSRRRSCQRQKSITQRNRKRSSSGRRSSGRRYRIDFA